MTVPYTTPPTAVAGQTLPAADFNTKIRDSLESTAKSPRATVRITTDQLIAHNIVTFVTWPTLTEQSDTFWVSGSSSRLTVPAGLGGLYLLTAAPIWDINATGGRYAAIMKNGVAVGSPANSGGFGGWYVQQHVTAVVSAVPGDYFEVAVFQSSGAGLNLKGSVYLMSFSCVRLAVA